MATYRVPVLIKGYAVVRFGEGRGVGDYLGGMPRDAEFEVRNGVPYLCGARMEDASVELTGPAELIARTDEGSAG